MEQHEEPQPTPASNSEEKSLLIEDILLIGDDVGRVIEANEHVLLTSEFRSIEFVTFPETFVSAEVARSETASPVIANKDGIKVRLHIVKRPAKNNFPKFFEAFVIDAETYDTTEIDYDHPDAIDGQYVANQFVAVTTKIAKKRGIADFVFNKKGTEGMELVVLLRGKENSTDKFTKYDPDGYLEPLRITF